MEFMHFDRDREIQREREREEERESGPHMQLRVSHSSSQARQISFPP